MLKSSDIRSGQPIPSDGLPTPDPAEQARSQHLLDTIQRQTDGLTFADYVQLVLSHPRWGYYAVKAQILGREGDFSTAPEFSSIYARCLAGRWAEIAREHAHQDLPFEILEIGPGSGELAAQVLTELRNLRALPARYCLYEPSPNLSQVQKKRLSSLATELQSEVEIVWLENIDAVSVQGVIFANEVVDVLPVEILRRDQGQIQQLFVVWNQSDCALQMVWRSATAPLEQMLVEIENRLDRVFADGYRVELHTSYPDWLASVARALTNGQLWVSDYGYDEPNYYHPQRRQGTFQCYYRHHRHDNPLLIPGLQDMSASVNFDLLYALACRQGFELSLYQSQGRWLMEAGALDQLEHCLKEVDEVLTRQRLEQNFMRLVMPDAMGEIFKLVVFSKYC